MIFDDSDGFDGEVPEDLRAWIERDKPDLEKWARHYILDEHGYPKPASLLEWGRWFEDFENRQLEFSEDKELGFKVSTVFLGLDHGFETIGQPNHEPVLFETCILRCDKFHRLEHSIFRYKSLAEAKDGHYTIVRALRGDEMPEFTCEPSIMNFLDELFGEGEPDDNDSYDPYE